MNTNDSVGGGGTLEASQRQAWRRASDPRSPPGQNGISLDSRRQGNRPVNHGARSLRRIDDFHRALIQDGVIVRFHSDPDNFGTMSGHGQVPSKKGSGESIPYLSISKRTA